MGKEIKPPVPISYPKTASESIKRENGGCDPEKNFKNRGKTECQKISKWMIDNHTLKCYSVLHKRKDPENGKEVVFRELSGGVRQQRAFALLAGERTR